MIAAVGVVVPARDEESLLPRCLAAIDAAATRLYDERGLRTRLVVVLDSCVDGTADAVTSLDPGCGLDVTAVETAAGNVGAARALGCAAVLRILGSVQPPALWLASTDADSRVPEDWLTRQVALAESGAEVVLGTVTVDDWSDHPPHVAQRWRSAYNGRDGHQHVHGANVGCRADAYLAAGGFPALSSDEDVALLTALAGRSIVATGSIPVVTSARRVSRAIGGFASFLVGLG